MFSLSLHALTFSLSLQYVKRSHFMLVESRDMWSSAPLPGQTNEVFCVNVICFAVGRSAQKLSTKTCLLSIYCIISDILTIYNSMDTSKFSQEEPGTQSKHCIACQKKRECAQPMMNPAGRNHYNRLLNLREVRRKR